MESIGLIVSIGLALAGYFITYRNNLCLTRRADRPSSWATRMRP